MSRLTTVAVMLLALGALQPLHAVTRTVTKRVVPQSKLTLDIDGPSERLRAGTLASFAPPLIDSGKFSFTAPGRSAASARVQTVERAFRFTPSGQPDNRRALSLGVTSRVTAPVIDASRVAAEQSAAAVTPPAAYNVDLAVGWRGFAVSGGYSRADAYGGGVLPSALAGKREAVDVGLSYGGKSWKTSLQIAAESGAPMLLSPLDRKYSVELGGAYLLTPKLSVTGGLRYKTTPGTVEPLRDDQSVYLGTAFSF